MVAADRDVLGRDDSALWAILSFELERPRRDSADYNWSYRL